MLLTNNKRQKSIEEVYSSLMKALVQNLELKVTVKSYRKIKLTVKKQMRIAHLAMELTAL